MPRIISTSSITGTGFMKCMPINFSGRLVAAASRVMEIEEVFEAISASGDKTAQTSFKMPVLISSFSLAASMTSAVSAMVLRLAAGTMRSSAASRVLSSMRPDANCRFKLPEIVAMPASMRSCATSFSSTRYPESAKTWAMPLPICPAPIIPTVVSAIILILLGGPRPF